MKKHLVLLAVSLGLAAYSFNTTLAAHEVSNMSHCNKMMTQQLGKADKQYDHRFIDAMIMHHQGAIDMAKNALANSQRPEIRQASQKIISDQNKEIEQMKAWRKQWYGE